MADLKRTRTRPQADGMTAPIGIDDPLMRQLIMELQARVNALSVATVTSTVTGADEVFKSWAKIELDRLTYLYNGLVKDHANAEERAGALARAIEELHTYVISNELGETVPAHGCVRITSYDPDSDIYTIGKPQGPGADQPELLLFTGYTDVEDGSLGLGYRPSDVLVKATYDAPDIAFEPTTGKGYTTQAASWDLLGMEAGDTAAFFIGMGAVDEEWDTTGGLTWIRDGSGVPGGDETICVYNDSGYTIPEACLVWTPGMEDGGVCLTGKRPEYPGVSELYISVAGIANEAFGRVWKRNGVPRKLRVTSYTWDYLDGATGNWWELGAWFDNFAAHRIEIGPITVVELLTKPYVMGVWTGKRTGTVNIHVAPEGWGAFVPTYYAEAHTVILDGRMFGTLTNGRCLLVHATGP